MSTNLLVVPEQQLLWKAEQETHFRVVDVSLNCVINSTLDFHPAHSKQDASASTVNTTKTGKAFYLRQIL